MLIKLYEKNPNEKTIEEVVKILKEGGIVVYPTDTIYAMGCDIVQFKSIQEIARLKGYRIDKAVFSMIGASISQISEYVRLDNEVFKLLKNNLPGPFTFILPTLLSMQRRLRTKRKEIGVRIPDNPIVLAIAESLGNPLITTSIKDEDQLVEYTTDPELIYEKYQNSVDLVIDGGYGKNEASTVINCTTHPYEIERIGIGELK